MILPDSGRLDMAGTDNPFLLTEMMNQGFEQTRKAMENYAQLFQKTMKVSPLFGADLNKKTNTYIEKNIAAANEFIQKLSQARDVQSLWQIQTDFIQTQWKNYVEQMRDIGDTATKNVADTLKDSK
jgi:hypothetical protein